MKTIIAGSRGITQPILVQYAAEQCGWEITEVISGGARGVDRLGEEWAAKRGIPIKRFIPDWTDKGAGLRRNVEMAEYADALIAIWDGESRGTAHMIAAAEARGLRVFVFDPLHRKGWESGAR